MFTNWHGYREGARRRQVVIEGLAGNVGKGQPLSVSKNADSRIEFLQVHAPNDFLSVSKNADSRHHVQYKSALSCIIVKIKIAESCWSDCLS